jgi:hypothetical protein
VWACSRRRCGVWWLAVAGRIDNRVGRLGPHAKALVRCCCLGFDGVWWWWWWVRLALVVAVVRWHSKCPRVGWLFVGWGSLAWWAAALARGRRLAGLRLAQPHAPPARLLSVGP